jgi:saccharopine dehydrogenase-like NADP-dependent oxidoreductase
MDQVINNGFCIKPLPLEVMEWKISAVGNRWVEAFPQDGWQARFDGLLVQTLSPFKKID